MECRNSFFVNGRLDKHKSLNDIVVLHFGCCILLTPLTCKTLSLAVCLRKGGRGKVTNMHVLSKQVTHFFLFLLSFFLDYLE